MRVIEDRERRFLRFEVRDTGVGVPAEKRVEIFEEFVQADSSHARRFGGSGLGLAISKRLVGAMGGEIGIDPAPGGGSIFWFSAPAIAIREATPMEAERLAGYRIAFVTRNAVLREGVTAQIRAAGGEVVGLHLPGAGKEYALPNVDAILIDAGTTSQPELPAWPDSGVRSIVLVTPDARGKLADLKALGFAAYLVKPIRQISLADRIRAKQNGASDSFALPAHGELAQTPIVAAAVDPRPRRETRTLKILLAEDNPINALLTRELLRRRGYEVKEVASGESAIATMAEERFDLVLTDIHMPGLDGIEATRRIRADEIATGRPRTPIVALTADVVETGKRACQEAGMDGFLSKPVDPVELDSMLAEIFPLNLEARAREAAA
jgi:CheY-like chemotaxis protein